MQQVLEENNNVMVIAIILDPMFKIRYIKWCFGKMYDSIRAAREMDEITEELEGLYRVFKSRLMKIGVVLIHHLHHKLQQAAH